MRKFKQKVKKEFGELKHSIWEIHNLTITPGNEENVLMATLLVLGYLTSKVMKKIPKQIFLSTFRN